MSLARLTAVLVLLAGCGAGDGEPEAARPDPAPRTAEMPAAEAQPPVTDAAPQPQIPAPEADAAEAPWRDCGRIRSPVDRAPQRVEARVFDCRAARRVAVRYLRNRSLPDGWGPADCAASRAACEQGGWGFRLVEE